MAPTRWPSEKQARAEARALACEIHSGFAALRQEMPFNVRASLPFTEPSVEVKADVERIVSIWESCRQRHGHEGPFYSDDSPTSPPCMRPSSSAS